MARRLKADERGPFPLDCSQSLFDFVGQEYHSQAGSTTLPQDFGRGLSGLGGEFRDPYEESCHHALPAKENWTRDAESALGRSTSRGRGLLGPHPVENLPRCASFVGSLLPNLQQMPATSSVADMVKYNTALLEQIQLREAKRQKDIQN